MPTKAPSYKYAGLNRVELFNKIKENLLLEVRSKNLFEKMTAMQLNTVAQRIETDGCFVGRQNLRKLPGNGSFGFVPIFLIRLTQSEENVAFLEETKSLCLNAGSISRLGRNSKLAPNSFVKDYDITRLKEVRDLAWRLSPYLSTKQSRALDLVVAISLYLEARSYNDYVKKYINKSQFIFTENYNYSNYESVAYTIDRIANDNQRRPYKYVEGVTTNKNNLTFVCLILDQSGLSTGQFDYLITPKETLILREQLRQDLPAAEP